MTALTLDERLALGYSEYLLDTAAIVAHTGRPLPPLTYDRWASLHGGRATAIRQSQYKETND